MAIRKRTDADLSRAMKDSLQAYAAGSPRFFQFISNDARVYEINATQPIVGREAFEASFRPRLSKRKVSIIQQDLQETGDQAILAQTLSVTIDRITTFVRQSVVWSREGDKRWRMIHI